MPRRPLSDALRLIYIVDARSARDGDHLDAALASGVTCVWLRAPGATGAELYRIASELRVRCDAHGSALLVGDRADVALAALADGVQLGHRSPPLKRIRPFFDRWIGVSCHSSSDLRRSARDAADFVVLSPLFGVPEKGAPLGIARFAQLRAEIELPVVGLGGIDLDTAGEVRGAGANGVAVIRALRDAGDPAEVARHLAGR